MKFVYFALVAASLALAGCGQSDLERTATGAVIGGAAGHVLAGDAKTGALIGGAAGATCRALGTCPNN
ncbi:MAG: hypothetical protein AAGF71_12415 [Pseudomonadota bacterium]